MPAAMMEAHVKAAGAHGPAAALAATGIAGTAPEMSPNSKQSSHSKLLCRDFGVSITN